MVNNISLSRPAVYDPAGIWLRLRRRSGASLALLAGAVAVLAGATVLTGWLLGSQQLTTLLAGGDAIKANTALGLMLLGAGVIWRSAADRPHRIGTMLVLAAAALGAATLVQYVTGMNFGIDQALVADPSGALGMPGRMSPLTAISLALLGAAAAAIGRPLPPALVLGAVALAMSLSSLNLFNTLFGGQPPLVLAAYTQMPTAVAAVMLIVGGGVTALLDGAGPLSVLRGTSPATSLARRMLPAAIILLIALVWLRVRGEELGLYDSRFGASLMLVGMIGGVAAVILGAAAAGRRLEREREGAQAERDRFFDLSLDMLATATPDGVFIRLNPAWEATLGYPTEELRAKPFLEFVHPDDREATLYETHRQFAEGKTVLHFQNRYRHRDGSYRWLEWTSQPAADGSVVYAVARDITVRKHEEERATKRAASMAVRNERLADRAVRDALTGLHNRAYLNAAVTRLDSRRRRADKSTPMAAIMFDLDHFGQFNKLHGHRAGDAVLRHFAELLRQRFRGGDVVARYGGEEFVVLLDNASRDDAVRAADQVRARLADSPIVFDGTELEATVSAGCAELHAGMTVGQLLMGADVGLSQAKRAGRNMVVAT